MIKVSVHVTRYLVLLLLLNYPVLTQTKLDSLTGKGELSISGIHKYYYKGELINLDVTIKNLTSKPLVVLYTGGGDRWVFLRVVDNNGKLLQFHGSIVDSFGYDTLIIPANTEMVRHANVDVLYANDTSILGYHEFLPGKYKVWASFGSLESNKDEFIVLNTPENEEEMRKSVHSELYGAGSKKGVSIAEKLIKDNPKSIYLPRIYFNLFVCLDFENLTNELKEKTLEFMDRFPQSTTVHQAVYYYKRAIIKELGGWQEADLTQGERNKINNQLEKIKARYQQNTRISRYLDEALIKSRQ